MYGYTTLATVVHLVLNVLSLIMELPDFENVKLKYIMFPDFKFSVAAKLIHKWFQ